MENADWHQYQVLTKRSSLLKSFITRRYPEQPVPQHIWLGVSVEELPDGLDIEGTQEPLVGSVESCHDHRIAMAFGILGAQKGNDITVRGGEIVDVSFPGFWETVEKVKARAP